MAGRTEALALIGGPIDEHFGADDVAEWQEHLHQLGVAKFLRQMVDEQIAALWPRDRAAWTKTRYKFQNRRSFFSNFQVTKS
jgi:hypothetical protein